MKLKEQVLHIEEKHEVAIDASRSSSWRKLIGATALIFRLVEKCRKKDMQIGPLSVVERKSAVLWWNRRSQSESFPEEVIHLRVGKELSSRSRLKGLSVVLEDGLMKVAGRLENSPLPAGTKRPVLLDSKHPYTKLLIQFYHDVCGHHGQERIANEIRQQYQIIGLKSAVRAAQTKCKLCQKRRVMPIPPEMGQLPKFRVENPGFPFHRTGLDYFGPVIVNVKRSNEKRYVALFTCLATRAVHLEIAGSLSSDSCIMAMRRFFARRGCPEAIYSDNGTNFVGANNELKRALKELDQDKIKSECSIRGVEWHYTPPLAPHFGGSWERLVRSVKTALGDVLQRNNLKEEVLSTFLAEAEHTINSHPLTHVPVDPNDPDPLTPNHFLIRRASNLQPIGSFDRSDLYGRKQWRIVQTISNEFWSRWVKEYLPTLLRRQKWFQQTKPIRVGDIVLEVNENLRRNLWPLGKVVKCFPGEDKIVRAVEIMYGNGHVLKRPVAKLCILDVDPPKLEEKTATS